MSLPERYDAIIVGAGPVGTICALALARKGMSVALVEAEHEINRNPRAATALSDDAVQRLFQTRSRLDARDQLVSGLTFEQAFEFQRRRHLAKCLQILRAQRLRTGQLNRLRISMHAARQIFIV